MIQVATQRSEVKTFWEHLDELRSVIIRVIVVMAVVAIIAFAFKDALFTIALAPCNDTDIHLINISLTEQLRVHIKMAVYVGMLVASPYILYTIFRYIAPALYDNERRIAARVVGSAFVMFIIGTAVSYMLLFPVTLRFLATYSVSEAITPMLSINSYIDTLLSMTLTIAVMFELPVACWMMARLGILKARWMTAYRRHAVAAVIIVAAIITPTTDAVTLFIVALPLWLLYELSVVVVRLTRN